MNNKEHNNPQRLIPLTDWGKFHSWPPIGGLRYLTFHANENGFSAVIRRIGKRVLISESDFFAWVESQNANKEVGND